MKMYILVKEDVTLGYAMVAVAHASLAGYLKFKDRPETLKWLCPDTATSFYKVICKVSDKEFEKAKLEEDNFVITESSLDNEELAIVFRPREEYPKYFKFFRLYK